MSNAVVSPSFALAEETIEGFYRDGYFYAPGLLTQDAVDRLNAESAPYVAAIQAGAEWKARSFSHFDKHEAEMPETARLLRDPAMVGIFEQLLGGKVRLWVGMHAIVAPYGSGLEWHQDNMYTHVLGHIMNVFIALDAITQDNAGLWIAPESHRLGRQPNLFDDNNPHRKAAEPANGIPCKPMAPGDAVFFFRDTLHHSKKNHTDKPRRALALQIASDACRIAATGKRVDMRQMLSR